MDGGAPHFNNSNSNPVSEKQSDRCLTSSSPVPPVLPAVMRPSSAVASAPAGGSREQEQGEAQGGTWGARAPQARVVTLPRVANGEWRIVSGEWEDEEPLASSPLAVRHSLFAPTPFLPGSGHLPHLGGARRPADGLSRDAPAT